MDHTTKICQHFYPIWSQKRSTASLQRNSFRNMRRARNAKSGNSKPYSEEPILPGKNLHLSDKDMMTPQILTFKTTGWRTASRCCGEKSCRTHLCSIMIMLGCGVCLVSRSSYHLSYLYLIYPRQDAFLRICRINQSLPDCLTTTAVIHPISVLHV